jgi:hypothetical protein
MMSGKSVVCRTLKNSIVFYGINVFHVAHFPIFLLAFLLLPAALLLQLSVCYAAVLTTVIIAIDFNRRGVI